MSELGAPRLPWGISAALALVATAGLRAQLPEALARADHSAVGSVEAEMHNVLYRADAHVTLDIRDLRGALVPTRAHQPPWFEDPSSFIIAMDSALVGITPASLTALLNGYTFNYQGSPLRKLEVTIDKGQLKQTGRLETMAGVPFSIRTELSVTPDGRLRLHPKSVKVLGLPVKGLMHLFSIELDKLVKVRAGRGVEVAGDDFLLAPAALLPPPVIQGRVTAVRLEAGEIMLTFGGSTRPGRSTKLGSTGTLRNFMYFHGAVLRFGKLTMDAADLHIVDADQKDPFEFFLAHLNEQLVAGSTHNQPDFGLVSTMPDYGDVRASSSTTSVAPSHP